MDEEVRIIRGQHNKIGLFDMFTDNHFMRLQAAAEDALYESLKKHKLLEKLVDKQSKDVILIK